MFLESFNAETERHTLVLIKLLETMFNEPVTIKNESMYDTVSFKITGDSGKEMYSTWHYLCWDEEYEPTMKALLRPEFVSKEYELFRLVDEARFWHQLSDLPRFSKPVYITPRNP